MLCFLPLIDILPRVTGNDAFDGRIAKFCPDAIERPVVRRLQWVIVRAHDAAKRCVRKASELSGVRFPPRKEVRVDALPTMGF
jgi:hypothetical protein